MQSIKLEEQRIPTRDQLLALYDDVGWVLYTKEPDVLVHAVQQSLYVWTAWDQDKLVGLARVVGDGLTIVYIQDILVHTDYQKIGIGSCLLQAVLHKYDSVRQIVLLTDDTDATKQFYEKNGLNDIHVNKAKGYMK